MEISCPDCEARYEVAPRIVPAGRSVRCVRCATTWTPVPLRPGAGPGAETTDAQEKRAPPGMAFATPPPLSRPSSALPAPADPRDRRALFGAWVGSAAVLLVLGWGLIHFRHGIATGWPPSQRLYATLGLSTVR